MNENSEIIILTDGDKQNWYLFNDFRISPSNLEEVVTFDISWKTCCVLYYKRVDMENHVPMPVYVNPITYDVFFAKSPFKNSKVSIVKFMFNIYH